MWRSATLAMVVSSTSMNVAMDTMTAKSQGEFGPAADRGRLAASADRGRSARPAISAP